MKSRIQIEGVAIGGFDYGFRGWHSPSPEIAIKPPLLDNAKPISIFLAPLKIKLFTVYDLKTLLFQA